MCHPAVANTRAKSVRAAQLQEAIGRSLGRPERASAQLIGFTVQESSETWSLGSSMISSVLKFLIMKQYFSRLRLVIG